MAIINPKNAGTVYGGLGGPADNTISNVDMEYFEAPQPFPYYDTTDGQPPVGLGGHGVGEGRIDGEWTHPQLDREWHYDSTQDKTPPPPEEEVCPDCGDPIKTFTAMELIEAMEVIEYHGGTVKWLR